MEHFIKTTSACNTQLRWDVLIDHFTFYDSLSKAINLRTFLDLVKATRFKKSCSCREIWQFNHAGCSFIFHTSRTTNAGNELIHFNVAYFSRWCQVKHSDVYKTLISSNRCLVNQHDASRRRLRNESLVLSCMSCSMYILIYWSTSVQDRTGHWPSSGGCPGWFFSLIPK